MPPRRFAGHTLVIASHNPGKVREIAALLRGRVARTPSAGELDVDDPEETGDTFVANAILKARHVAKATGLPALADDSGLVVPLLGGAPGILTARWAERETGERDFPWAMERLRQAVVASGGGTEGTVEAHFVCALAVAWPDGAAEAVEGRIDGHLVWPARGGRGFGFDPIFQAEGREETFGEMAPEEKLAINHRARAFARLLDTVLSTETAAPR